jgi:hypothetical protein
MSERAAEARAPVKANAHINAIVVRFISFSFSPPESQSVLDGIHKPKV